MKNLKFSKLNTSKKISKIVLAGTILANFGALPTAHAQYGSVPGYGWNYGAMPGHWYGWGLPYGWSGWNRGFGGASTVPGSILDGWGYYLNGAGYYNRNTAIANAINVDTWMRWAAAINQTQMQMNYSNYLRRQRRHARLVDARRRIFERLRDNPEARDVRNGDAINVKMRLLMQPGFSARVVNELQIPVQRAIVEQLIVAKPAEGITANLRNLAGEFDWPMALRSNKFSYQRNQLESATKSAWQELNTTGHVEPSTILELQAILAELRAGLDADHGTIDQSAYANGRAFLKTQTINTRAFSSEALIGFFTAVAPDTLTLGQLLEAMTLYGIQFHPATSPTQVAVYERLYAVLRGAPPTVLTPETFSDVFAASNTDGSPIP